eukprot:CAMPEP_0170347774 /NCGR_PEP_ID=MMETSP0116_2-20130129/75153_1 /TAXON_ID=400756 /ORGANISM="Durinskia baltica, Strain CSIRO CS-38" /LENGTH=110 /DNA_ID=CAMNT_0010601609 /DNA_START=294 /DNA_END=624 /DNA_ORIENTATION=+
MSSELHPGTDLHRLLRFGLCGVCVVVGGLGREGVGRRATRAVGCAGPSKPGPILVEPLGLVGLPSGQSELRLDASRARAMGASAVGCVRRSSAMAAETGATAVHRRVEAS